MTSIVKNHETGVTKAAQGGINAREAQVAHRRSFGDLVEKAAAAGGLPGDQVPYWDPMGFLASGPSGPNADPERVINFKNRMFEKWEPAFERFNQRARGAEPLYEIVRDISKSMERSDFSMPIFFTPDVFITDQEDLPLADMLARTAVAEDTVKVDEITSTGSASQFSETATTWPNNDDSTTSHTYDVKSYGRENDVTDFVQLAANTLRSTRALTEDQQVRAIRQYEERQIILGQAGNIDASSNDANGFKGFGDYVSTSSPNHNPDESGGSMTISKVRDAIRSLRREGASRDDIIHVTDHKTFQDLQESTEDFTRYDSPGESLNFGFQTLEIDGTPIFESHGSNNSSNERMFLSFDASAHYMAMLQDVTMHPLARSSPQETFATDAYGTLVSESPNRIHLYEGLN